MKKQIKNRESRGDRFFRWIVYSFLTVVGLVSLFPLYYITVVSFTDSVEFYARDIILFPTMFSLESYKFLLSTSLFPQAMKNSVFYVLVGTPLHLLISSTAGYALSRTRMTGRKTINILLVATMFFHPGLIPNYLVVRALGMLDSLWAIILPGITGAWTIILMRSFFSNIPESLEESAFIDGANDLTIWSKIMMPLSLPMLAAFGLFSAVAYWNVYMEGVIYINDFKKYPLQVVLQNMLSDPNVAHGGDEFMDDPPPPETLKMAAVVITVLPIMCVYPFLQKHFAKGVMLGSVKG